MTDDVVMLPCGEMTDDVVMVACSLHMHVWPVCVTALSELVAVMVKWAW